MRYSELYEAKIIQRKGLRPGQTTGTYNDLKPGYSEKNVYLVTTPKGAEFYAKRQAKKEDDARYAILQVTVPDPSRLLADDRYVLPGEWQDKVWMPHPPERLRKIAADKKRLAWSGRENGEFAYPGIILPKHITLYREGKTPY